MESSMNRLSLNDLSTVNEQDERSYFEKKNISRRHAKLEKYKESENVKRYPAEEELEEADFDFDADFDNDSDFDNLVKIKLRRQSSNKHQSFPNRRNNKGMISTPVSNNFITMSGKSGSLDKQSISSSSSRASSSVRSQYTESDTDNSDYAHEFEDFENNDPKINPNSLIEKFKLKQEKARQDVENTKKERLLKYDQLQSRIHKFKNSPYWNTKFDSYTDGKLNDEDFDDFADIDLQKLKRFGSSRHNSVGKKKSMPVMRMGTSLNGSPKKVKKYASTLDMNTLNEETLRKNQLKTIKYPIYNGDELDDIQDMDQTITLSDYKKMQRKLQNSRSRVDLSKFSETPSSHHGKHHQRSYKQQFDYSTQPFLTPQTSKTSQLTKEGKIRLIRSLGKPKVKKVMPAHMYGELSYDPFLQKWCGNDEELARFESINYSRPKLISKSESIPQTVNGMVYDDTKLRWVSVTGSYEDDPFGDDFDNTIHLRESDLNQLNAKYKNNTQKAKLGRLVPSESTMTLGDHLKSKSSFKVTPEMYKLWKHEEERWIRKVGNWFPDHEDPHSYKYELKTFLNQQ